MKHQNIRKYVSLKEFIVPVSAIQLVIKDYGHWLGYLIPEQVKELELKGYKVILMNDISQTYKVCNYEEYYYNSFRWD